MIDTTEVSWRKYKGCTIHQLRYEYVLELDGYHEMVPCARGSQTIDEALEIAYQRLIERKAKDSHGN